MSKKRRQFGERIDVESMTCAPINEHGVVYLFGVLHEVVGFKVESIQKGFPDCVARREIGHGRWEEVRIEFEFESKSFSRHGHDPDGADVIVCWKHDWKECPAHIEIIELSRLIQGMEKIREEIQQPKQLSAYNRFCREKRLEGVESFAEIGRLWREAQGK